jgi:acyl dehydratase
MTVILESPDALLSVADPALGATEWVEITQERINQFADATGDHQWIHVDPEKAKDGPFGAPIAHGYLTLAMANLFLPELIEVQNTSMGINYGVNKVRFPSPVVVGARIRAVGNIDTAEEIKGGVQVVITLTIEIEGSDRPACVVETVSRFLR